jgi:hypothetical protein
MHACNCYFVTGTCTLDLDKGMFIKVLQYQQINSTSPCIVLVLVIVLVQVTNQNGVAQNQEIDGLLTALSHWTAILAFFPTPSIFCSRGEQEQVLLFDTVV